MSAYATLEERFGELSILADIGALLNWDQAVVMSVKGSEARGQQFSLLSRLRQERLTSPDMASLIDQAHGETLSAWQAANLREMTRIHEAESRLPVRLVEQLSEATTSCEMIWRRARAESDFATLLPELDRVLSLTRESLAIRAETMKCGLYEAAFSRFEAGLSLNTVNELFDTLGNWLPAQLTSILDHQSDWSFDKADTRSYAEAMQKSLGEDLMKKLGFDFDAGRLDTSAHPFCGGISSDIRITTRYRDDSFADALMGVLHETGHALYEAGLPAEWHSQPVGNARGMTVHESQSLFVEMQLCRSVPFLKHLAPILRDKFGHDDQAYSEEALIRQYHRVRPSLIRVEADEVTYPLHVILRTRLEQQMIEGQLSLKDLPEAWNEGMRDLLGIVPDDDATGCLQDVHWPVGLFGYFPCYSLGALLAAQLADVMRDRLPEMDQNVESGNFAPIMDWLKTTIHSKGCLLDTEALIVEATGTTLKTDAYQAHITRRYLP